MNNVLKHIASLLSALTKRVNALLFQIALAATAFMLIPTVLDVAYRQIFQHSIMGAMELVEFSLVLLVFGSLSELSRLGNHIRVDLLLGHFSPVMRKTLELFAALCPFFLIALMASAIYAAGLEKLASGEKSGMLGIPHWPFFFFAAFGMTAFALELLSRALKLFSELVEEKHALHALSMTLVSFIVLALAFLIKDSAFAENLVVLGAGGMGFLMLLIILGMPIGLGMALIGSMGMIVFYPELETTYFMLGATPYNTASNYVYSVVPMFILMGELAMFSGISRDLFNAANVWLGRLPGGLAVASVCGCAGFAAVSGDSMAAAVTMASVALPEMNKKKYDSGFSCASLAAGGTLGILIPPSTGFIFYSLVTEVSIGKLFVAGILPGLLLTAIFIGNIFLFAARYPHLAPRGNATPFAEKFKALNGVIAMVLLIALILGGILFG